MHLVLPAYDYRTLYRGVLTVSGNTISIRKIDTVSLTLNSPINPVGTYAVRLNLNAIRDLTKTINHSNDEYPIIFVFNPHYGRLGPGSKTSIAYLGGAVILSSTNDQDINYLFGYSKAWVYKDGEWHKLTVCKQKNNEEERESTCKLYLTLVVDPAVVNLLEQGEKIRVEVHVDNGVLTANDVVLYAAEYRKVNVFERSFTELWEPNISQCISSNIGAAEFSLCPVDAEVIHLGAQLAVKGMVDDLVSKKRRYIYFVMPTVISYSAKLPHNTSDTALPKDEIFNTALFRFSITRFSWEDALQLIDWLWDKHRDAVIKLFLNMNVMRSLWRIFGVSNVRVPFIEHTVTTQFYNKYLINYSLNLWQFTELYYKLSRNQTGIADLVKEIFAINGVEVEVNKEQEDAVKRVLAIYALMYGLHGISHLLMKALAALTGFNSYGELVSIVVDRGGLSEGVINTLRANLFDTQDGGGYHEVYHENIFHVELGSQFQLDVNVFSRKGYSFHYFRELLSDKSGQLDANKIIDVINNILLINGNDRCEYNWSVERRHLEFGRAKFIVERLSDADSELKKWISNHYRPTRTLFRIIYSYRLIWDLVDLIVGESSEETKEARSQFMKRFNRHVQFMWPYHLEQCIDGCYNCVLVSRSIKSNTCDMTPLMQELKTSKWAALYLLRHTNLFNAAWMG